MQNFVGLFTATEPKPLGRRITGLASTRLVNPAAGISLSLTSFPAIAPRRPRGLLRKFA
jgi:hypothetical protein